MSNPFIVLAGGAGSRLSDITKRPKCLVKVQGESILLTNLIEISKVAPGTKVYINHRDFDKELFVFETRKFAAAIGDAIEICLVSESVRYGTAGTCMNVMKKNGISAANIVYGDQLYSGGIKNFFAPKNQMFDEEVVAVLAVKKIPREKALESGVVFHNGKRVTGLIEKPGYDQCLPEQVSVNLGLYSLHRAIEGFDGLGQIDFCDHVFPQWLKNNYILEVIELSDFPIAVDTPEKFRMNKATL